MLEQMDKEKKTVRKLRQKYYESVKEPVSIITPTNKPKYLNNIFDNYARLNYPNKELIIILNNSKMDLTECRKKASKFENIRVFRLYENYTLGSCLNFGIKKARFDYIAKIDDDDYYGSNYLQDLMNVFKYTDAEITGKNTHFIYFERDNILSIDPLNYENKYVRRVAGATLLIKKRVFDKVKFRNITCGEDTHFLIDCNAAGIKIYSADKYNYVCMRHKTLNDHTWKITEEELMDYSKKILTTSNCIPYIEA